MVFRLTDKNGDGSITSSELKEMLHTKLSIDVDDALLADLMNSAGERGMLVPENSTGERGTWYRGAGYVGTGEWGTFLYWGVGYV